MVYGRLVEVIEVLLRNEKLISSDVVMNNLYRNKHQRMAFLYQYLQAKIALP